jgi:SAM-dependent methyltransferase
MDYDLAAENIRASYREVTPKYRQDDEVEVTTENHLHLSRILGDISSSFDQPIVVLDAGCGTGRYFHCLQNVRRIVGLDVSPDMLKAAEQPVLQSEIKTTDIQLVCGNIFKASFPSTSFDFIYSLGMFGHGCPVTLEIINQFYDWLKPGGRLFFNVVDFATLPPRVRLKKRIRKVIYAALPQTLQRRLDERQRWLPFSALTRRELQRVMQQSHFRHAAISSHRCHSPLWRGLQLECSAIKNGER